MNIGLLIHPCEPDKPGGLGRANFALSESLLTEQTEHTYTVFIKGQPRPTPFSSYPNTTVVFLGDGPLWLTGARKLDRTLDAYVFFAPLIPLFFRPKRSIVIAFDFAFLTMPARSLKHRIGTWFLYLLQARSLRIATTVLSISDATRTEAVRLFGIPSKKIHTIHVGYMTPATVVQSLEVPERFFLFAGVLKERKNVAGIIRAFALFHAGHPDFHLIIAGKKEGSYYGSLVHLTEELGIAQYVRFVGYVSNEELAYLYQKAIALVFPSLVEGFGMPVLEAMHAGLPVITSNIGALAEVAGDAALLVNPHDPSDIARALATLAEGESMRDQLRAKGYARAAEFSWQIASRELTDHLGALE